jgi:hypothetical protein
MGYNPIIVAGCDSFKGCSLCKELKPLISFHRNAANPSGYSSQCIVCYGAGEKKRIYGLDTTALNLQLKQQNNKCAICDGLFTKKNPPKIDHCHISGKNRKLLCDGCNVGLGRFKENPKALRKAADYLEEYMSFITTKIVWNRNGDVVEQEGFLYEGPVEKCCGASSQQNAIEASQANYYNVLTQQAQQEFGQASTVFNDIYAAMSPIVAAGPDQQGFSQPELQNLNSTAIQGTGQAYSGAAESVRQQEAAQGGSNFVPSGATMQENEIVAGQAAAQEGSELNQIQAANYATGRQNYFTAAGDLAASTGTYNPATGAAGAANQGGSDAATTANQIAQENNSWMQAVSGALGGVTGSVVSGGMSNLGKGVGFFGQNAPAPS